MDTRLSDLYWRCHQSFESLLAALNPPKRDIGDQLSHKDAESEFDKLRLWARNVGAMYSEEKHMLSLDYRLRESPFYRARIISFMTTLEENVWTALSLSLGFSGFLLDSCPIRLSWY